MTTFDRLEPREAARPQGTIRYRELGAGEPVVRAFPRPAQSDRGIRRELAAILRGASSRYTLEAVRHFGELGTPVLIAWATGDRVFPFRDAERLAAAFPNAHLERIEDSYTFVSIDQPARTGELIAAFARASVAA
jgi:pimeloyl-ACP methyl ester carboxylesterase